MLVGHIGRIEPDFIGGWAADTDDPDSVVDVVIYVDGKRVAQVSCDNFRQDLRDLTVYGQGNHGLRYAFPVALSLSEVDRVTVRFARTGAIVPNGEKVLPGGSSLRAVLVTAPGRSGTTLMMGRLSLSPQVCIAEKRPYEIRHISYWATVVGTLASGADFERSMHPDRLEGDGFKVGSSPFSHANYADVFQTGEMMAEYFRTFVPGQLRDMAHTLIEEYYLRLRHDQGKPHAAFFAEKNNNLHRRTRNFARALFPDLKEIVLIRDPRDLLCSQLSYFRHEPDLLLRQITEALHELLRIKRDESDGVMFVRYEDLILDGGPVLARLAEYLDIGKFQTVDEAKEKSTFEVHGTSVSPEASIGRWTTQLTEQQRSWCTSNWSAFLSEFCFR